MNRTTLLAAAISASFSIGFFLNSFIESKPEMPLQNINLEDMKLGAFSISLSVKNLEISK